MSNFSERLSNLFYLDNYKLNKLYNLAKNKVDFWINKFISDGSLNKRSIDGLEILVKHKEIPEGSARDMFGRLQPSFTGFPHNQIIVNVNYCIIGYQGEWKNIYKSLEDFIGNIALHEVCHLVAWSKGYELRNEDMHGPTWQKYYNKYRSLYTETPLMIYKDGTTNFENKFSELWNDYNPLKLPSYSDKNISDGRMGDK